MDNSTFSPLIKAKLNPGDSLVNCHQANLMQGWVRASRIMALVNHTGNHAFLVFLLTKSPPQTSADLTLELAIPVDTDFKCGFDSDNKYPSAVDVYVNISSKKLKLLFEMEPGMPTSNFVDGILQSVELCNKNRGPPADFQWVQQYHPSITNSQQQTNTDTSKVDGSQASVEKVTSQFRKELHFDDSESLPIPRPSVPKGASSIVARESVIRHQMSLREAEYTYSQNYRVFIGTWNVNGQPPTVPLHEWLAQDEEPPDIYAIGFQELDLSKEAFLFNDSPREAEWLIAVTQALHPKAQYYRVQLIRLVGMMLLIFAQEKHRAYIRAYAAETVGTGIMGKMGNKGGVAVRLDLHNTSFCFVNSHLAAHVEEFERRNQDFHDICSRMIFSQFFPPKTIKDHDHIYWLGDLNYRITEMDPQRVKDLVAKGCLEEVLQFDQLRQQHAKKTIYSGYIEGPITFQPTYKYDPGTHNWDSSEKNRAPAWCDRVLWKGEGITQLEYRSHPILKISDHKPVSALFNSEVQVIDPVKHRRIYEETMKKLDRLENEELPQVMVDTTEIIFDTVRFHEHNLRELIIANTGQVPVRFAFVCKLDDTSFCKEWLHITPCGGDILPGEQCNVTLDVFVDKNSAYKLNSGEDKLYDILVLHLEGGKDIFITVSGSYERSCYGLSIEALVYIAVPVSEMPIKKLMDLENGTCRETATPGQEPYPIPKEIWFLVDQLYRCGLDQQHLFEHPGLHTEFIQIRDWLDKGSSEPMPGSIHSVAEALLMLLNCTAEPLFPYNFHHKCLSQSSSFVQCKQIVQQLPEHRRNVFLYICSFLQEVLNHADRNGLDPKMLASLFGGIFFRDPLPNNSNAGARNKADQVVVDRTLERKKSNFVYHFLVNNYNEFIVAP